MSDQSGTCNAGGQATFSVPPTANRVLIASSLGTFLPTGRLLLPPSSTSNQLHLMSRLQGTHWEPLEVGRRVEGTAIFFFFGFFCLSLPLLPLVSIRSRPRPLPLPTQAVQAVQSQERAGWNYKTALRRCFLPSSSLRPFLPSFDIPSRSRAFLATCDRRD